MSTEAKAEWTHQYFQGVGVKDLPELGSETLPENTIKVDFTSPFEEEGTFEIVPGKEGPGSGGLRLTRVKAGHSDTFIVPMKHIEEVIIIVRRTEDGTFTVVVVPTAAVGASSVKVKYPKIIRLHWPCPEPGKQMPNPPEGEGSVLKTLEVKLNEELAPLSKEVIVYIDKAKILASEPMFKCFAQLDSVSDSYVEKSEGALYFLSKGILWLGESTIYLSKSSLSRNLLTYSRDASAAKGTGPPWPIVAMGLFMPASEPFYKEKSATGDMPEILVFNDIENYKSTKGRILSYFKDQGLEIEQVEQIYYDYKEGTLMTGFSPLTEE